MVYSIIKFLRPYTFKVLFLEVLFYPQTCIFPQKLRDGIQIFRIGVAICTSVVVARSTSPNRPKCEFRVLLRRFAATVWKRAKTSHRNLARTDLAASPWQRPVSHFRPHPTFSGETNNGSHPPPAVLPWFGTLRLLLITKSVIKAERTPVWYHWGDPVRIAGSSWHSERKGLQ
jgi:hypothetical protein